jgi:hypothetical protein
MVKLTMGFIGAVLLAQVLPLAVVKLSDAEQRLVFTVHDPVHGTSLWGQADFKLRPKR